MKWVVTLVLAANLIACGQLSREDLLSGNFGNADRSAPVPLSPVNDAIATNLQAVFTWAPLFQAKVYYLEIAEDAAFTIPIAGSPFKTSDTTITVSFPEDKDYYWRLFANTTASGVYSKVRRIRVLGNSIRVYCPQEKASCGNLQAVGNRSAPFETIQPALNLAKGLGIQDVLVAARGGGAYYSENTLIMQDGVNLLGGYNAADWQRSINVHVSEIRTSAPNAVFLQGLSSATFEGFTLRTLGPGTAIRCLGSQNILLRNNRIFTPTVNDAETYAIRTEACMDLMIEQNSITGGNMQSSGGANPVSRILQQDSGTVTFRNNTVQGGHQLSGNSGDGLLVAVNGGTNTMQGNVLVTGHHGSTAAVSYTSSSAPVTAYLEGNQILCKSPYDPLYATACIRASSGLYSISLFYRRNFIEIHNFHASYISPAISIANSVQSRLENNVILAEDHGMQLNNATNVAVHNNTVFVLGLASKTKTGVRTTLAGGRELRNNIVAVLQGTTRLCVDHDTTGYGYGYARVENNNFFGCSTIFKQHSTLYDFVCTDGKPGTTSGCATGVDVASTSTVGNVSIDDAGSQLFENIPKALDTTKDGPDANTSYDGTTTSIEVSDCNTHGQYVVGEYIEYDFDGVARQITAVNCTASASLISFSPALNSASTARQAVRLWGSNNTNLTVNAQLKSPVSTATCNVLYGGLNLSANFTTDFLNATRTAVLPISGVCNGYVTNGGAAGWSMGAYERD
jgi:hypothetical protein